jgi:hydroxymethylbilane synthase
MSRTLTVATRGGDLAIAQTRHVISALKRSHPDLEVRIHEVTTSGDRDRRTALWNLKSTGFFTSQVEDALLAGQADFAVHSFKDLPTAPRDDLAIAAVFDRVHVEDCIVATGKLGSLDQLPPGARIGTSSLRRAVQLKRLRSDLVPTPIRGNVRTRMKLAGSEQADAVILARAGLERLGLGDKISMAFDPTQFLPAAAQGALAIQTRADDPVANELIAAIDDYASRTTSLAERQVLTTMRCGCHAPVGVYAQLNGDQLNIRAFVSDVDAGRFISRSLSGPATDGVDLAKSLAEQLLSAGGAKILEELEKSRSDDKS